MEHDYLNEFLVEKKREGIKYIRGKRIHIKKLLSYLDQQGLELNEVGIREAAEYRAWLIETGKNTGGKYRHTTINGYIEAATDYYGYLKKRKEVHSNPFRELARLQEDRKLPRNILKEHEMDEFLSRLEDFEEPYGLKNKIRRYKTHVLGELLYSTGMRISEAAGLAVEDIDFTNCVIDIREGKGGMSRKAFLGDYAKAVLLIYIYEMKGLVCHPNDRSGLLFGMNGDAMTHRLNAELREVGRTLGHDRVTSHMFRHAFGYHLLRAGCGIRHIQNLLGHKDIDNTEIYTKVDREDLKRVLESYHPLGLSRTKE